MNDEALSWLNDDNRRYIDGDTVVEAGKRVRLTGGDAPERAADKGAFYQPEEAGAEVATQWLRENLPEATERLSQGIDPYRRELVEYRRGGENVMTQAVRAGVAFPVRDDPASDAAAQTSYINRITGNRTVWDDRMDAERAKHPGVVHFDADFSRSIRPESVSSRAVDRSFAQLEGTFGAAANYLGERFGLEGAANWGEDVMADAAVEAALNPAEVASYEDINNLSTLGTFIKEKVIENTGTIGSVVAGAAVGGVGGAALAAGVGKAFLKRSLSKAAKNRLSVLGARTGAASALYPQHMGETWQELRDAGVSAGETNAPVFAGAIKTVLDLAPAEAWMRYVLGGLPPKLAHEVVEQNLKTLSMKGVLGRVAKTAARASAAGSAIEGVTETAQELIDLSARAYHDPSFDISGPEAQHRLAEAFAGGAAVGGVFAGAGGTVRGAHLSIRDYLKEQADASEAESISEEETDTSPVPESTPPAAPPPGGGGVTAPQSTPAQASTQASSVPEPRDDAVAQLNELARSKEPGRVRFLEQLFGVPLPGELEVINARGGGVYIIRRGDKLARERVDRVNAGHHPDDAAVQFEPEAARAALLGYQQTKLEAMAGGAPVYVQGTDAQGREVHGEVVNSNDRGKVEAAGATAEQRGAVETRERTDIGGVIEERADPKRRAKVAKQAAVGGGKRRKAASGGAPSAGFGAGDQQPGGMAQPDELGVGPPAGGQQQKKRAQAGQRRQGAEAKSTKAKKPEEEVPNAGFAWPDAKGTTESATEPETPGESAEAEAPRVVLPQTSRFTAKDQAKSDKANKFIGRGSKRSSTARYAEVWGDRANTGEYAKDDRVFVSAEGARSDRVASDFTELGKATAAGATIITDVEADRKRSYNVGEREVARFLVEQGYAEERPGEWVPKQAALTPEEKAERAQRRAKATGDIDRWRPSKPMDKRPQAPNEAAQEARALRQELLARVDDEYQAAQTRGVKRPALSVVRKLKLTEAEKEQLRELSGEPLITKAIEWTQQREAVAPTAAEEAEEADRDMSEAETRTFLARGDVNVSSGQPLEVDPIKVDMHKGAKSGATFAEVGRNLRRVLAMLKHLLEPSGALAAEGEVIAHVPDEAEGLFGGAKTKENPEGQTGVIVRGIVLPPPEFRPPELTPAFVRALIQSAATGPSNPGSKVILQRPTKTKQGKPTNLRLSLNVGSLAWVGEALNGTRDRSEAGLRRSILAGAAWFSRLGYTARQRFPAEQKIGLGTDLTWGDLEQVKETFDNEAEREIDALVEDLSSESEELSDEDSSVDPAEYEPGGEVWTRVLLEKQGELIEELAELQSGKGSQAQQRKINKQIAYIDRLLEEQDSGGPRDFELGSNAEDRTIDKGDSDAGAQRWDSLEQQARRQVDPRGDARAATSVAVSETQAREREVDRKKAEALGRKAPTLELPAVLAGASQRLANYADATAKILRELGLSLHRGVSFTDYVGLQRLALTTLSERNQLLVEQALEDKPPARVLFLEDGSGNVQPVVYLSSGITDPAVRDTLALHEVGHVVLRHVLASADPKVTAALEKMFSRSPEGFEEGFAQAFERWMEAKAWPRHAQDPASRRLHGIVDRFFRDLWQKLRQLFREFKRGRKVKGSFSDFMEALLNRTRKGRGEARVEPNTELGKEIETAMIATGLTGRGVLPLDLDRPGALNFEGDTSVPPGRRRAMTRKVLRVAKTRWERSAEILTTLWDRSLAPYDAVMRRGGLAKWADYFRPEPGKRTLRGDRMELYAEERQVAHQFVHRLEGIVKGHAAKIRPWHLVPGVHRPSPSQDLQIAFRALEGHEVEHTEASERITKELRSFFDDLHAWLKEHHVAVGHLKNYVPILFDAQRLIGDDGREEFHAKVRKWFATAEGKAWGEKHLAGNGPLTAKRIERYATSLYAGLSRTDASLAPLSSEDGDLSFLAPGFGQAKHRQLPPGLVEALDAYREKDLVFLANNYVRAAVRRGLWQERFGGQNLPGAPLTRIVKAFDVARAAGDPADSLVAAKAWAQAFTLRKNLVNSFQRAYGIDLFDPSAFWKIDLVKAVRNGDITPVFYKRMNEEIIPGLQGVLGADAPASWRRFQALAMTYQAARLLSFGSLSQFVDIGLLAAHVPPEQYKLLARAVREALPGRERAQLIKDAKLVGMISDTITEHMLNDVGGLTGLSRDTRLVNEWIFKANGMHWMTNQTRAIAVRVSKLLIEQWTEDLGDPKLAARARDHLAELGISPEQAKLWVKQGSLLTDIKNHAGVIGGIHQFVNQTILHPDASMRGRFGNNAWVQILWHLSSFMWAMSTQVLQRVWNQSVQRWGEEQGARKALAVMPLVLLAAWTLPLAALGLEIRWLLDPPENPPERGGFDYAFGVVSRTGMLGYAEVLSNIATAEEYGRFGLTAPLGPSVSQFEGWWRQSAETSLRKALPFYAWIDGARYWTGNK